MLAVKFRSPIQLFAKRWPSLLMAAYGAGWCLTIPFIGNLYAAEVIAALFLPFLGWKRTLAQYTNLRLILAGYGLILFGLIVADLINVTPLRDLARGWANPVFAAISLIFVVCVLRRDVNSFLYFLFATFFFKLILGDASYTLRYSYVELSLAALQDPNLFKVRIIPFLTPAVVLVAFYVHRFGVVWSQLVYACIAVALLFLGARSASIAFLLAAAFLLSGQLGFRYHAKGVAIFSVIALFVAQILYVEYVDYSVNYDPAGRTAVQLSRIDNPYNPLEFLAQARNDWSIADVVVGDSPVFGHGSWARDPERKYFNILLDRSGDPVDMYSPPGEIPLLPTHSFILSSWIWGGLAGFLGAMFVFWIVLKTVRRALICSLGAFSAIAALVSTLLLWDLLFSPLQVMRVTFPHLIGLLLVLVQPFECGMQRQDK